MLSAPLDLIDSNTARAISGTFTRHYRTSGREFPWRDAETSPFHVLMAELLLRQTDAPKVSRIWAEMTSAAPDAESLLRLDTSRLRKIVTPLGLGEQRTQALRACCQGIVARHHGDVPRNPRELLTLPHVGIYGAAAVTCFAFNRRNPVVDGNVLRVLGRLVGEDFGSDNRRSEAVWKLAWSILPARNYRTHNYGLLDFASHTCTARNPKHVTCPLRSKCRCYQEQSC